jgi:hypothetical protein
MSAREAEKDWLSVLVQDFEDSEYASQEAREKAERDRDYFDNKQYTDAEADALKLRGQPVIADNHIRRKVEYLSGLEKQRRTDPVAMPRTPKHGEEAEAATDVLRFICDENDFPTSLSAVWENMLVEGAGGVDVYVMPRKDGTQKVCITEIPWDRMFWDAHSRRHDFSDAAFIGVVIWMDEDAAKARWPGREDAIESTLETVGQGETYDDRPRYKMWVDSTSRRVRVVQMWKQVEGVWHGAAFTRGGFLEDFKPSPYLDDEGEPSCPLIFQSAYVDRDNNRYGIVRDMIDQQDEINKRRSKALHLLSVRQVVADQGAVQDVDAARREMAKPDGYVEVAAGMRFEVQQTGDLANGQALLLQQAQASMAAMGPNASMQGKDSRDQSGRAIALQQQGGVIEADALGDRLKQFKRRVWRAALNRAQQFWTEETTIRVTDDEKKARFVTLNRQMTLADELLEMPQEQAAQIAQQMGLQEGDPRLQQVVRTANTINDVPFDIVIDESPDVVTLQSETFAMLTNMVQSGLALPPASIIEASPLRQDVKEKILKHLSGVGADGQPMPPPPEVQEKQAAFQLEQERFKFEQQQHADMMALKAAELQTKAQPAETPMGPVEPVVDPIDVERLQLDAQKHADDVRLKEAELALKYQLEGAKLQQSAQTAQTKATERAAPNTAVMMRPEVEDRIASGTAESARAISDAATSMQQVAMAMADAVQQLSRAMSAPKRVIRGPDGRAVGVETVEAA